MWLCLVLEELMERLAGLINDFVYLIARPLSLDRPSGPGTPWSHLALGLFLPPCRLIHPGSSAVRGPVGPCRTVGLSGALYGGAGANAVTRTMALEAPATPTMDASAVRGHLRGRSRIHQRLRASGVWFVRSRMACRWLLPELSLGSRAGRIVGCGDAAIAVLTAH